MQRRPSWPGSGRSRFSTRTSVSVSQGAGAGGVDLAAFREWLEEAGAEAMLGEFLATFRRDAPVRLAALEQASAAGDLKAIERAAHAYRSAAVTIFAVQLGE